MVEVIPRSVWGARHEDGGGDAFIPFTEWWLHHSVTIAPDLVPPFTDEYAAMRTLEDIGEQRFGRGISYTFPIMPNGRVYQGHSVGTLGAHTGGRNSTARAICLVGNYDGAKVTAEQIESAAQLMVQEYRAGRATRYTLNGGHRQLKATSCPGNNGFAAIPIINARAEAIMAGAPVTATPPPPLLEDSMFVSIDPGETRVIPVPPGKYRLNIAAGSTVGQSVYGKQVGPAKHVVGLFHKVFRGPLEWDQFVGDGQNIEVPLRDDLLFLEITNKGHFPLGAKERDPARSGPVGVVVSPR